MGKIKLIYTHLFWTAAMPFLCNGILLNHFNLLRVNLWSTLKSAEVHKFYPRFPFPYFNLLKKRLGISEVCDQNGLGVYWFWQLDQFKVHINKTALHEWKYTKEQVFKVGKICDWKYWGFQPLLNKKIFEVTLSWLPDISV